MRQPYAILAGAGGHALSLMEFAGERIYGYLAPDSSPVMPKPWLGTDDDARRFVEEGYPIHIAFVYAGLPLMHKRAALIKRYEEAGAGFETLIAPTAIVTPNARIGEGTAVMAGAIVNRAILQSHIIVNSGAIVEHDCLIGENTFIGPGAVIGGFTEIGRDCFIGLGARVGNNIKIGPGITVAMGAVVNKNLEEPGIYHGFPLRHFKVKS